MGNEQCCLSRDKRPEEDEEGENLNKLLSPKLGSPRGMRSPLTGSFLLAKGDDDVRSADQASIVTRGSRSASEVGGLPTQNMTFGSDGFRASHSDFIARVNEHFRNRYELRE